jgi:hypothetical protein
VCRTVNSCVGAVVVVQTQAVFSCFKVLKILQDFSSHRIFDVHGALNIGKKK